MSTKTAREYYAARRDHHDAVQARIDSQRLLRGINGLESEGFRVMVVGNSGDGGFSLCIHDKAEDITMIWAIRNYELDDCGMHWRHSSESQARP